MVQMSGIFNNSKVFVDMKSKDSPKNTLQQYETFISQYQNSQPDKTSIQNFVNNNFDGVGLEYEPWTPPDLNPNPKLLDKISNPYYKSFASYLNQYWANLGRKQVPDVAENPDRYSIIPLPNPIIVESETTRNIYYWDSYFMIVGLLASGMYDVS